MRTKRTLITGAACLLLLAAAGGCGMGSITGEDENTTVEVPVPMGQPFTRSAAPTVIEPLREKDDPERVTFTLSAVHTGVWAVYSQAAGSERPEGVEVRVEGTALTLRNEEGLDSGTYYITVTEEGKLESARVPLSVVDYPGQSVTPMTDNPTAFRNVDDTNPVTWTLSAAQNGVWAVYDDPIEYTQPDGVKVSVAGTALTLSKAGGVPAGTYYVSVWELGRTAESARLALKVRLLYTITYNLNGAGDVGDAPAAEDVEEGGSVRLPSVPRQGHYAFLGWWTGPGPKQGVSAGAAGAVYTLPDDPPRNITLYANWDQDWDRDGVGYINLTEPLRSVGSGFTYDQGAHTFSISQIAPDTEIFAGGTTTTGRITVAGTVTVTLYGAVIDLSGSSGCPFDLEEGAEVTVRLWGVNTLTAGGGVAGIHVPAGRTLKITSAAGDGQSSGTLAVTGNGAGGAGIGGNTGESDGTITVAGGTVTVNGNPYP